MREAYVPPSGHTQKERIKLRRVCLFLCKTGANCRFYGSLAYLIMLFIVCFVVGILVCTIFNIRHHAVIQHNIEQYGK